MRQGEDHMKVAGGQQLALPCRQPAFAGAVPWHLGQCRFRHEL